MSEGHSSGSGMGKTIVLVIFGVMVGFYGVNVINSGKDAPKESHVAIKKHVAPKFTEKDFEELKAERDQIKAERDLIKAERDKIEAERDLAVNEVAKLTEDLAILESRAVNSEYRLGRVRNLLVAEDRVSAK